MDAESLVTALVRLQLVTSAAILLVLLLRPLALRWFGAGTAYWLWLVVPLAAMAVLLPAREQVVTILTAADIPILQQHIEPDLDVGVTWEHAAAPLAVQPEIPDDRSRSGLLIALWLLGAGVLLIRSIVNTRRLASGSALGPALVGVLRPRLVLPQDFEARFNAEERALILAHEEMHRVSRHALVNALVEVARCASWFNPLVHWAAMRFRSDQELACDTAVIAAHPQARRAYAEALLKAQVAGVYLPMGCVWTSGTAGRLAERIARLSEQLPGRGRRFVGAASIVGIGIAASYAAWAQQPPRIITVLQPNPESAAVVAAETPVPEAAEAARAPATGEPGTSRPSTSQVPASIPTAQAPQSPFGADVGVTTLRLAFAMDAVIDDRVTVNGQPNPTYGTPVCRVVRDGVPVLDTAGRPLTGVDALRRLAADCRPINIYGGSAAYDENTLRRMAVVTGGAFDPTSAMLQYPAELMKAMKEWLKDPEHRKRLLVQWRTAIKHDYPRLGQELGLSEDETERLFDLLAYNRVTRMAEGPIPGGPVDQQERQEALRINQEFDRREEESIQALLGDKYAQWQAYQENRNQRLRVQIERLRVQLERERIRAKLPQ